MDVGGEGALTSAEFKRAKAKLLKSDDASAERWDGTIPRAEVLRYQSRASMWAVVDDHWVVNVTGFLPHHPGGAAILGANLSAHFSFAHGRK